MTKTEQRSKRSKSNKPILAPGQNYLSPEEIELTRQADERRLELDQIYRDLGGQVPPPKQYASKPPVR